MKNIETIKLEIDNLNKQIFDLKSKIKNSFHDDLKSLVLENKDKFDRIEITVNNHEFNDGDATRFSLYYDDMVLVYLDEQGEEVEQRGKYGDINSPEMEVIRQKFVELFSVYDVDDIYESIYGDEYGRITIESKEYV
jgi:hypothetical protein